jgi:hypothetical protein
MNLSKYKGPSFLPPFPPLFTFSFLPFACGEVTSSTSYNFTFEDTTFVALAHPNLHETQLSVIDIESTTVLS